MAAAAIECRWSEPMLIAVCATMPEPRIRTVQYLWDHNMVSNSQMSEAKFFFYPAEHWFALH